VIYDVELVLFTGSEFAVRVGDRDYTCEHGSFIVVPPGSIHSTHNSGNGRGQRYWVHFSWEPREDLSEVPIETYHPSPVQAEHVCVIPDYVPEHPIVGTAERLDRALELHERISYRWNLGDRHEQMLARALLLELLIELLDDTTALSPTSSASHLLAHRVRRAIESAVHDTVLRRSNLSDHLTSLGYSYEHLSREFRKVYGFPPADYLNRYRIESAKSMLRESTLGISDVADRLGFSSAAYFCRVFRDRTGVSPTEYRRGVEYI
jgi:AraC family transcriptional regulator of arabinose operon